jgi:lipopolysaccharide biosynthesis protein
MDPPLFIIHNYDWCQDDYPLVNVYITMGNHHAMKIGKSAISMGHGFRFAFCKFKVKPPFF